MSRILPILFNTDMVRAILDGRKTVTRRGAKKIPVETHRVEMNQMFEQGNIEFECHWGGYLGFKEEISVIEPPYQPGDILYVRETFCWEPCWDCGMDTEEHNCCDESAHKFFNHNKGEWGCYGYRASLGDNVYPSVDVWRPSIHMPKEAARIWLKVTHVRVERLQEITDEQATAEGIREYTKDGNIYKYAVTDNWWIEYHRKHSKEFNGTFWQDMPRTARKAYSYLWNSTLKKSDLDRYGWDANPWVWVIEFEKQLERMNCKY